jgi:ATP-dependent DNA helicase RecQ
LQDLTLLSTLLSLLAGVSIDEIAVRRDIKPTTVYSHLARCIEEGELRLRDVVQLTDDEIRTIQYAFEQLAPDAAMGLKPVYEALQGSYDYGLLRCVRAGSAAG